jgi:hypothetical protein
MVDLEQVANRVIDIVLIVFPILAYLPQYRKIKASNSVGSFSTAVCLILLTANLARIFFWAYTRFRVPLLFQSFLMLGVQGLILASCVRRTGRPRGQGCGWYWQHFWGWGRGEGHLYWEFLLLFCAGLSAGCLGMRGWPARGDVLGYFSAGIESALPIPQLLRVLRMKSGEGLSLTLIGCWLVGDVSKAVLFGLQGYPVQFVLIGVFQAALDVVILGSMLFFRVTRPRP